MDNNGPDPKIHDDGARKSSDNEDEETIAQQTPPPLMIDEDSRVVAVIRNRVSPAREGQPLPVLVRTIEPLPNGGVPVRIANDIINGKYDDVQLSPPAPTEEEAAAAANPVVDPDQGEAAAAAVAVQQEPDQLVMGDVSLEKVAIILRNYYECTVQENPTNFVNHRVIRINSNGEIPPWIHDDIRHGDRLKSGELWPCEAKSVQCVKHNFHLIMIDMSRISILSNDENLVIDEDDHVPYGMRVCEHAKCRHLWKSIYESFEENTLNLPSGWSLFIQRCPYKQLCGYIVQSPKSPEKHLLKKRSIFISCHGDLMYFEENEELISDPAVTVLTDVSLIGSIVLEFSRRKKKKDGFPSQIARQTCELQICDNIICRDIWNGLLRYPAIENWLGNRGWELRRHADAHRQPYAYLKSVNPDKKLVVILPHGDLIYYNNYKRVNNLVDLAKDLKCIEHLEVILNRFGAL